MTWRTSEGSRVLEGDERSLVLHSGLSWLDAFWDDKQDTSSLPAPLRGQDGEVISFAMLRVLEALLTGGPEFPLTAWSESLVMEIFYMAVSSVETEVMTSPNGEGHGEGWFSRTLIRGVERQDRPPEAIEGNEDFSWADRVDWLADRILHDRDFENESIFVDLPPKRSVMLKTMAGVDSDYFVDTPGMPSEADQARLNDFHDAIRKEGDVDYRRRTA